MLVNSLVWNPNPIALDFGFFDVSWYGLTWSFSIILAYLLLRRIFVREGKDPNIAIDLVQYVFLGALIGARVLDVFYYHFTEFLERPLLLFEVWNGGLASHGAMIGTALAVLLFSKVHKQFSFWYLLDLSALIMPALGALVRIGNFINGELYGKTTSLAWGVIFESSDPLKLPRHPIQLYEAVWLLSCFFFFWFLAKYKKLPEKLLSGLFLSLVLGGRFLLEFLKDSSTYYGNLSNTQLLSILAVLIGLSLLLSLVIKGNKSAKS
ncbi:MAG: prolipoprotein diacylglyceryl transferase [Chitinophagales bacterium]|nr:prolipoprotein diacylglyceryl transferase [Bacteroidota bacterium]MCB9255954.1 prolipoprotein diacylglyceryl transferase [Chitinophagales bacterium]